MVTNKREKNTTIYTGFLHTKEREHKNKIRALEMFEIQTK